MSYRQVGYLYTRYMYSRSLYIPGTTYLICVIYPIYLIYLIYLEYLTYLIYPVCEGLRPRHRLPMSRLFTLFSVGPGVRLCNVFCDIISDAREVPTLL